MSRRSPWARVFPVLLLVLALAGAAVVVVQVLDRDEVAVPPPPELSDWPADLRPFVRFVERERDLSFREVVPVDFLAPAEFEEQVTDDGDLTDEDRAEVEQAAGELRALGLIDDDVDLLEQSLRLQGAGVVGLYSFEDQRIRVRGDELTTSVETTLVHELTHALQDQHFDIGARVRALPDSDEAADEAALGPFRAIVEGDASRVESAYVDSLSRRTRAALERQQAADRVTFEKRSKGIPPVMVALLGAPYALGESLLDLAVADEDEQVVDDLLRTPPTTDEALLDPWVLIDDDEAGVALETDVPPTGEGEDEIDSGAFGALSWYVVLAQRVDPRTALRATDGWGGDAYSSFEREGRTCVRLAFRGDTRRDVAEMAAALEQWIAVTPGSALLQRTRTGLVFASCETPSAPAARSSARDALQLPVVRSVVAGQVRGQGAPSAFSRCYARVVVEELTLAQIASDSPEAARAATRLVSRCR